MISMVRILPKIVAIRFLSKNNPIGTALKTKWSVNADPY